MMKREDALKIVYEEREYQDANYPPTKVLFSGATRAERDREVGPHIMLLESYAQKARESWVSSGSNFKALQEIAKIAAIALRALERVSNSEALLVEGLR